MSKFVRYLAESEKEYRFRLKFANLPEDFDDSKLETHLEKYGLKSLSAPKKTPIQQHPSDFQTLRNADVHIMDAVLTYPVTTPELLQFVADVTGLPDSQIVVINSDHPEELEREEEAEAPEEEYEPLLTKDYELEDNQDLVGEKRKSEVVKNLETKKYDFAGKLSRKKTKFNTDQKEGKTSPVGTKKVAKPKPKTANEM